MSRTFPRRFPSGFFVRRSQPASPRRSQRRRARSAPSPSGQASFPQSPGSPRRIASFDPATRAGRSRRDGAGFILVTGGARSGKSRFAVTRAASFGRRIAYLATCKVDGDQEMRRRIIRHRRERPKTWITLESPRDPAAVLLRLEGNIGGAIIDCLTLFVSSLLLDGRSDVAIQREVRRLCRAIRRVSYPVILVTNEVGSSVVPEHELGRRFRDLAGLANQTAAGFADQVFLLVAGIPLQLKGASERVSQPEPTTGGRR